GKAVLFGSGAVRLLLPPVAARGRSRAAPSGDRNARRRAAGPALNAADEALFEALRAHRLETARAERVPPYVVASDRTLRELAELRPQTIAALEGIYGIGPAKAAKYGEALMTVVRQAD
ncbi:MAG: HRDC domain-containing protein, partial [Gemmatimonadaceae bacterium]